MSRRRKLTVAAVAALLVALPAGWYFGSPWWTLWRMREAARAGDLGTLGAYADFERIAATDKAQAKRLWGSVLETPLRDTETSRRFIALARRKLAEIERGPPPAPLPDLRAWLDEIEIGRGLLGPLARRGGDPYVLHHGLTGFELRYSGASWEYGPVLTFERRGLGWRLVAVRQGQQ